MERTLFHLKLIVHHDITQLDIFVVYRNENGEQSFSYQFSSESNNNKISGTPVPSEYEKDPDLSTQK